MENKTHWKKLQNPDFLGAYCLMESDQPKDLIVKIKSIARQQVTGADGKSDECTVAQIEVQKPFIINATNSKMLTRLFNSPFIEDWIGKPFTLYVAKIKVAGDPVDALRIRPDLPVIKLPELNEGHQKWKGAVDALNKGNTTIEAIKKSYILTKENEELICKLSKSEPAQEVA